jgi:hypothetical protein
MALESAQAWLAQQKLRKKPEVAPAEPQRPAAAAVAESRQRLALAVMGLVSAVVGGPQLSAAQVALRCWEGQLVLSAAPVLQELRPQVLGPELEAEPALEPARQAVAGW